MDKHYRIKANIGVDQVLNVNLQQGVDLYEILTLSMSQRNAYRIMSSDYGVIVGRVLANNAFGVPNAKVSVFIGLNETDAMRTDLSKLYPYKSITDYNADGIRYNTLPDYKVNDCHVPVGTFPNKRMVLDDDSILEVYDKYYKYTTVTNNAGDYMIFGVPVGSQTIHVDVDLSDVGILSQKPRDMLHKGYSLELFANPSQFKEGTNLDNLAQIMSQTTSIDVYPFWGDKNSNQISITRKDINLQYEFQSTCVFMGSVVTDSSNNYIGHTCEPSEHAGDAAQLIPCDGTIEMIRKRIDGAIEEYNVDGNQHIDSNGVFCYQIPMNLDYVGMDEYGNIVPTNNPSKGIATRARVRFRFTLNEVGNESSVSHKARYLVPNNPDLYEGEGSTESTMRKETIEPHIKCSTLDDDMYYEFGSKTPDECFRDLYWNKIYSVKSYIPRIQLSQHEKTPNYLAIKGVNKKGTRGKNIFPYNKINLNFAIDAYYVTRSIGINNSEMAHMWNGLTSNSVPYSFDSISESVMEELDGFGLDFYNDWINGCLYFPMWFWHVHKKGSYKNSRYVFNSIFCECGKDKLEADALYIFNNCSLEYAPKSVTGNSIEEVDFSYKLPELNNWTKLIKGCKKIHSGVIKKFTNKDGAEIYYYSYGNRILDADSIRLVDSDNSIDSYYPYARLFSTDIILLGSLNECDIDGIPMFAQNLPATTSNIPPMGIYKYDDDRAGEQPEFNENEKETKIDVVNGMMWGHLANNKGITNPLFSTGLFFGLTSRFKTYAHGLFINKKVRWYEPETQSKTCINVERICELGVTFDSAKVVPIGEDSVYTSPMDGLITFTEINDPDIRSIFASLNSNKLVGSVADINTTYRKYNIDFLSPVDFDGKLSNFDKKFMSSTTIDMPNADYVNFRFGSKKSAVYHTKGISNVSLGLDYVSSVNEDGTFEYAYKGRQKGRHFNVYDVEKKAVLTNTTDAHYVAFPIYNNSFYFFFGIVAGSTAIDKLYTNYFSECKTSVEYPFSYEITTKAAMACNKDEGYEKGNITVKPANIDFPYTVEVYNASETSLIASVTIEANQDAVVPMSDNGTFVVKIIDRKGNEMKDTVTLRYNPISLLYTMEKNITTQYLGQSKCTICNPETELYGIISLDSVVLYGNSYKIKGIIESGIEGDDGKYMYKLALNGNDTIVKIIIYPLYGGNYIDYACGLKSCSNPTVEMDDGIRKLYIYRPATYMIKVIELCKDGSESNNVSFYSIEMTDKRKIDIYLNTVPLKFIVGQEEDDIDTYGDLFYKVGGDYAISDISMQKGWFALHDEKSYKFPSPNSGDSIGRMVWSNQIGSSEVGNVLSAKLGYMFSLCSGAYVTAEKQSVFTIESDNIVENTMLRTAFPTYSEMSSNNTETAAKPYNGFRISNIGSVTANTVSPNIVSENYRELDAEGLPVKDGYTTSVPYCYNKKYYNEKYFNGNYMAAFSNNANIVEASNGCEIDSDAGKYTTIPINAHSLYENNEGLCVNGMLTYPNDAVKFNTAFDHIYHKNGTVPYFPYFRAEFVDRRFDYDILFIAPHNRDESELQYEGRWWQGRMSGMTYNGIEMLYRDDVRRTILSEEGNTDTEYTYNMEDAVTTLSMDSPKRFYSTTISYGNGKNIDLRNGYHYKQRDDASLSATCEETSLDFNSFKASHAITDQAFDNFGLRDGKVCGYPSKRYIDFVGIPYNDYYTFSNVSCSYNGISVEMTNSDMTAGAVAGESVQFKVNTGNLIVPILGSFDSDISTGEYNLKYSYNGGTWVANNFRMSFNIKTNVDMIDSQFKTKIEDDGASKLGIRILKDDAAHTSYSTLKMSRSVSEITSNINSMTIAKINGIPNVPDTTEEFMKTKFETGILNILGAKNVGIMFDRYYYNITRDSLMKKIRVINTSAVYNCDDFTMNGSISADLYDRVTFSFTSNYFKIGSTVQDLCFKVNVGGEEHAYKLSSMSTSSNGNSFTVSFMMKDHLRNTILEYGTGKFEGYMKLQNELIIRFDFCLDKYSNISIC